jgi:N-acetylneuraminate synthase/N,N'-diacetyllegionaminate synthase
MPESPVIIIAEAGVNHNGDLGRAEEMVHAAAEAGADYVKFQTFRADQLVSPEARQAAYQASRAAADSQLQMLRALELNEAAHEALIGACQRAGIRFLSTAFDLSSLEYLASLGLDRFKVPSGEITHLPYLRRIAAFGKPLWLSTGMASLGEIEAAVAVLESQGLRRGDITILHCNTAYPTPMADVNLRAMQSLAQAFGTPVGYSDHTLGIEVPIAAVALGAVCIEKHFTLDRSLPGPDHAASLEPAELKAMVSAIRNIEAALGSPLKQRTASERENLAPARKSIFLSVEMAENQVIEEHSLIMKRPGDGISPMEMDRVLGRRLRQALPAGTKLRWEDLI